MFRIIEYYYIKSNQKDYFTNLEIKNKNNYLENFNINNKFTKCYIKFAIFVLIFMEADNFLVIYSTFYLVLTQTTFL
jgi:hypothetical protein